MYVKFSLRDLNLSPYTPHLTTSQAFILVEWPPHQGCTMHLPFVKLYYLVFFSLKSLYKEAWPSVGQFIFSIELPLPLPLGLCNLVQGPLFTSILSLFTAGKGWSPNLELEDNFTTLSMRRLRLLILLLYH